MHTEPRRRAPMHFDCDHGGIPEDAENGRDFRMITGSVVVIPSRPM